MPEELKLFYRYENDHFLTKLKLSLNGDMQKFCEFLTLDCWRKILRENKLTIHIETENIYYDNFKTNESISDFIFAQQDGNKKKLKTKLSFGWNLNQYIPEFLASIKAQDDNRYDMLTKKYSKFLFCRFNDFLQIWNRKLELIRHFIMAEEQENFNRTSK